ncbi:DMT family transporter [Kitasatospora sp. NPDC004272]
MVLAGGLLAAQAEVNGRLAARLGTGPRAGLAAGIVSIAVGLLALLAAGPFRRAGRGGDRNANEGTGRGGGRSANEGGGRIAELRGAAAADR